MASSPASTRSAESRCRAHPPLVRPLTYLFARMAARLKAAVEHGPFSRSFVPYGLVSVAALALELAVLHAALAGRLYQPVAVSVGYSCSAIFQFCALRYIVFKAAKKTLSVQAAAYFIGQVALWALLLAAVTVLTTYFPLNTMQARLICIPTLFPVNYFVSKHFIFRK